MTQYKSKNTGSFINIDQKNFKTSGGEGDIYVKGNTVYKLCYPGKMIPERKIEELTTLNSKYIIIPKDILLDKTNRPIGYTMDLVPDSYVFCQLFTKTFRERNKIDSRIAFDLIRHMQKTIEFIHSKNILIVDLNELNFLVNKKFDEVYFIDTNSYQTPSCPATAIMESIKDRHTSRYSTLTDWFSFAIVSFNTLICIHPFKGNHTVYKTLDERMLNNISILNATVSYPKGACYDLSVIPSVYLKWYEAVFERGLRLPPPDNLIDQIQLTLKTKTVQSNDLFIIKEIESVAEEIIYNFKKYSISLDNNILKIEFFIVPAEQYMIYKNRLYIKYGDRIEEVFFNDKLRNLVYTKKVSNCLEYATKLYDGLAIENIFGDNFAIIFPQSGQSVQIKLKELYRYKVIDAKYENGILIVIGIKNGKYNKFRFIMDSYFSNYNVIVDKDITNTGLNFVVLDNGLLIEILNDSEMKLSKENREKILKSNEISLSWQLGHSGNQVFFTENNKTYSLEMK